MCSSIFTMKVRPFSFKHKLYTHSTHTNYLCPPTLLDFPCLGGRGVSLFFIFSRYYSKWPNLPTYKVEHRPNVDPG